VEKKKLNFFPLASLIITFLSFALVIYGGIILNEANRKRPKTYLSTSEEALFPALSPSEVLNKKSAYSGKKITVRGKVVEIPVVCQKKECPPDDTCCGCPEERGVALLDEKSVLISKTGERLELLSPEGESFCRREKGSCQYNCGDWRKGAIYEVYGEFKAEPPPPGWQKSLDFYFRVEEKRLVKNLSLGSKINFLIQDIKDLIKSLKKSGEYVLP